MVVILYLRWWYSAGWQWVWSRMFVDRLIWVNEVFSTGDISRTLFAPYRQTYAGQVNGSLGDKFRGVADRLISRIIGFIVRLFLLFGALIGCLIVLAVGLMTMIVWPFLPFLPVIGPLFMILGVGI